MQQPTDAIVTYVVTATATAKMVRTPDFLARLKSAYEAFVHHPVSFSGELQATISNLADTTPWMLQSPTDYKYELHCAECPKVVALSWSSWTAKAPAGAESSKAIPNISMDQVLRHMSEVMEGSGAGTEETYDAALHMTRLIRFVGAIDQTSWKITRLSPKDPNPHPVFAEHPSLKDDIFLVSATTPQVIVF